MPAGLGAKAENAGCSDEAAKSGGQVARPERKKANKSRIGP